MTTEAPARELGRATAELSLLIDIGSAWTKAAVVGRAMGRWRIAAHAAQPSAWDEEELVATLAGRLAGPADPRVARRMAALLADAPRIAVHTPARPGRIALACVLGGPDRRTLFMMTAAPHDLSVLKVKKTDGAVLRTEVTVPGAGRP